MKVGELIKELKKYDENQRVMLYLHENVTATKQEIYEIVDYVTDKMNGGGKEE